MKVSVVIPVYNEEKYIQSCLKSIFAGNELPDEVIVVDNNCIDATIAIAKTFPNVRIVKEKAQGMTLARNRGFNRAKYEIIARTDADTIVSKNWIKHIRADFEKNPQLVGVSGPANHFIHLSLLRKKTYLQGERVYFRTFERIFHHHVLVGPNMAIRKTAWEKIKNEVCLEDKMVHEDIDLSIHLGQIGKIMFDKKMQVFTSFRRWQKLSAHWEYPYRYARTLQHHKQSLHGIKVGTQMVGNVLPKPRKIMKKIKLSAANSLRLAKSLTR